jgi:Cu/Ag efflux pump CusA
MVVDGAVVMVENIVRHLSRRESGSGTDRNQRKINATRKEFARLP